MSIHTKAEFDQMIERIKTLVEKYENNILHYNQYQFYLANGERISFEITPQSVAHLLGIRLDYLRSTGIFKNQDSYNLLKEFIDGSYSVYRNAKDGHLSFENIFSDHFEEKLEAFENIIYYTDPDDIEFVCKYEKDKIFQLGEKKNYLCNYFIAKKLENGDICLLGLIQNENKYCPMSSLLFQNDENQKVTLSNLLANQTLTVVNAISIFNTLSHFQDTFHLNLPKSLKHIRVLNSYQECTHGLSIDTSSYHQFSIKKNMYRESKISTYKLICQRLISTIEQHEIFNIEQIDDSVQEQLDEEMIQMIGTYNNAVCQGENTSAQITYTNLLEQYRALALQVDNLNEQLKQAQEESMKYQIQVQELQAQNAQYQAFQEQIFTAVENQKQKVIVE